MNGLLAVVLAAAQALAVPAPVDAPPLDRGLWSWEVVNLRTGAVVSERQAHLNVRPASTLKLFSTAAALDAFGPDYRHVTTVRAAGTVKGGVLSGDLQLAGGGDPNLSGRFFEGRRTAVFEKLADALKAQGITAVAGAVVGNEAMFSGPRRGDDWTWDDLVWWYGAEVSALSFNDNCADVLVAPGARVGAPVVVTPAPRTSYFKVISTATTGPAGSVSTFTLERELDSTTIRLSGVLPMGTPQSELSVALPDPARYAATVFREVLLQKGIRVRGGVRTTSEPPAGRELARHEGETLGKVVEVVNKRSQNLHAELLLRLVGTRDGGRGTAEEGLTQVEAFARRLGVDLDGADLQDGSGLSRSNLVSARALRQLLAAMHKHAYAAVFRASLPIAGVDGSLRNRMKGTAAEGRVLAKTGSIRHVWALAGYATTRGGEPLAFALIANNHNPPAGEVNAAMDAFVNTLVDLP